MAKDRLLKCFVIATITLFILICIGKFVSVKTDEYILIQTKVAKTAENDMGKNCTIESIRYDFGNKEYHVKVVNEQQNQEITYIAFIANAKTKECYVEKFIERKKVIPDDNANEMQ